MRILNNSFVPAMKQGQLVGNWRLVLCNVGRLGITARVHIKTKVESGIILEWTKYEITAGKIIECHRDNIEIFGIESFFDPQNPTDAEVALCSMMTTPWGDFDTFMVGLSGGLARLFHNDASEAYVIAWIEEQMGIS